MSKQILLLSDTHGYLDPALIPYMEKCDEIWHAGDLGDSSIIDQLEALKPLRAVWGNIDDRSIRERLPEDLHFQCEGLWIYMIHIGGYPRKYVKGIKQKLQLIQPDLFVCGHSHILKVQKDPALNNMIHLNPGAIGQQGFHQWRTFLTFEISKGSLQNLQAVDFGKRGKIS